LFRRRKDDEFPDWDIPDELGWGNEYDSPRGRRSNRLVLIGLLFAIVVALAVWWRGWGDHAPPVDTPQSQVDVGVAAMSESIPEPTAVPSPIITFSPSPPPTAESLLILTPEIGKPAPGDYDPTALAAYMLRLINADRAVYGLRSVAWDETAAQAGAIHAADMIAQGYFSHWNTEGLGPDHRYALLGGEHAVGENLHSLTYTHTDGSGGAPIEDWSSVIEQAESGLMLSPGHRANILDPAHTHVGIGMAYDPIRGEFRLAQEFTDHYVSLTVPPPVEAPAGSTIRVAGRFADRPLTNFILSLDYEPWPTPMTPAELNRTNTYRSAAESRDGRLVDRVFDETLELGVPGIYHVRLFVDLPEGQALVTDRLVIVR